MSYYSVILNLVSIVRIDMLNLHANYIVNSKGQKTATVLSYKEWQKVVEILEEYEDIKAYDKAKKEPSNLIPWAKAKTELKTKK